MATWAAWEAWTSSLGRSLRAGLPGRRAFAPWASASAALRRRGPNWRKGAPEGAPFSRPVGGPGECHPCGAAVGQNPGIEEPRICTLVQHKWAEYRPVLPHATLRFLDREHYLDAARADQRVRDELVLGWFDDFEREFREPVLADVTSELVTVCPPIMREWIEPEPPRIQRAYVEGAFLRRMFRLLVDDHGWGIDAQVRDVMARHYSFHLAAVEAVESGT